MSYIVIYLSTGNVIEVRNCTGVDLNALYGHIAMHGMGG